MKKPIYIYLKKTKNDLKLSTIQSERYRVIYDHDKKTGELVGIEILDYHKLTLDGKEIK